MKDAEFSIGIHTIYRVAVAVNIKIAASAFFEKRISCQKSTQIRVIIAGQIVMQACFVIIILACQTPRHLDFFDNNAGLAECIVYGFPNYFTVYVSYEKGLSSQSWLNKIKTFFDAHSQRKGDAGKPQIVDAGDFLSLVSDDFRNQLLPCPCVMGDCFIDIFWGVSLV